MYLPVSSMVGMKSPSWMIYLAAIVCVFVQKVEMSTNERGTFHETACENRIITLVMYEFGLAKDFAVKICFTFSFYLSKTLIEKLKEELRMATSDLGSDEREKRESG